MFAASSLYPEAIMESIAITAFSDKFVVDFPITPCGSCRQVMSEYETRQRKSMKVILKGAKGEIQLINKIADLLPFMFNADDLKQK
jgi:cytidine deaminase